MVQAGTRQLAEGSLLKASAWLVYILEIPALTVSPFSSLDGGNHWAHYHLSHSSINLLRAWPAGESWSYTF